MQLGPGTRLAHYEISSLLGKGGMGEVWRARDTKLGRDVAIKVLPDEFTRDGERLARFEREARVLASLDHPHVATIFGLEDVEGGRFLVMQLAEGEELAERLQRGAIPVDEAIAIACQIAEALEVAHEKGIVHRDLKPANVKVDSDGQVSVLDFGLAKALEVEEGDSDISNSPTMVRAATHAGVILGTAAYMSPEQARGKKVDRRADIWSFGVVLWEMLTGQRMFLGETVSDTLAAVLTKEPDLDALPPDTPVHVTWILRRCLVRDPKKRLRDVGEARLLLEDPETMVGSRPEDVVGAREGSQPWKWLALVFCLAAVSLLAALLMRETRSTETLFLSVPLPPDTRLALGGIQPGPPAVSPDGTRIAFVAEGRDGAKNIWVRNVGEARSRMIQDTAGASYPFWSWDGIDIGFFADQKMKRVPAAGGSVLTIADAPSGKGGTWNRDGLILFCPSFNASIYKVLATGGDAEAVTALDVERGDSSHRFPQYMDDGKHFTYLVRSRSDEDNVVLFSSLDSTTSTVALKTEANALVVGDRILYLRDRTLVAQVFDQSTGVASGPPVPLAERAKVVTGAARMVVAAGPGLIVMQSGEFAEASQLVWVDRAGQLVNKVGKPGDYFGPRISPDGARLAVELGLANQGTSDIWIIDTASGNGERLTFEAANDISPVWSPDGRRVAYASNQQGPYRIMVKDVNEASDPQILLALDDPQTRPWPEDWPSEDVLVFVTEQLTSGTTAIWTLDLNGDLSSNKIAESTYRSPSPDVSPDGRWIVFGTGIDQGAPGIVVADFPDAKRRWEVARGGRAYWSGDGRELFYTDVDDGFYAVDVRATADAFAWGLPRELFRDPTQAIVGDGNRFLITQSLAVNDVSSATFDAILGWEKLVE